MYKLKAKVLISKNPSCNCGGFYHPGEIFEESDVALAKGYITKGWVDVLESPQVAEEKENKQGRRTKEFKV